MAAKSKREPILPDRMITNTLSPIHGKRWEEILPAQLRPNGGCDFIIEGMRIVRLHTRPKMSDGLFGYWRGFEEER